MLFIPIKITNNKPFISAVHAKVTMGETVKTLHSIMHIKAVVVPIKS